MPKYYCDYCGSSLTHDSMSVRKSHSVGKHHIKLVIDYYETVAIEDGLLPESLLTAYVQPNGVRMVNPHLESILNPRNPLDQTEQLSEFVKGAPGTVPRETTLRDIFTPKSLPYPANITAIPEISTQVYAGETGQEILNSHQAQIANQPKALPAITETEEPEASFIPNNTNNSNIPIPFQPSSTSSEKGDFGYGKHNSSYSSNNQSNPDVLANQFLESIAIQAAPSNDNSQNNRFSGTPNNRNSGGYGYNSNNQHGNRDYRDNRENIPTNYNSGHRSPSNSNPSYGNRGDRFDNNNNYKRRYPNNGPGYGNQIDKGYSNNNNNNYHSRGFGGGNQGNRNYGNNDRDRERDRNAPYSRNYRQDYHNNNSGGGHYQQRYNRGSRDRDE